MLFFPQLLSGNVSQYPLSRTKRMRTVVNERPDGGATRFGDPDHEGMEWDLQLSFLDDQEWGALETLFQQTEGGLQTFTFMDPGDNLLAWSESLSETAWQKGALVTLTEDLADPMGDTRATKVHNGSATAQAISQTLEVSAGFHYCLGAYLRSDQPTTVQLKQSSATASKSDVAEATSSWRRVVSSGTLGAADEAVTFGVELPASGEVEVFGLQVEAQIAPSEYKRTTSRGGVHSKVRFLDDSLTMTGTGPGQHAVRLRIGSSYRD
ncbi:MAG: hypothetical protein GY953_18175 [bacterium]|nr:hypothetical protein [bacterium]